MSVFVVRVLNFTLAPLFFAFVISQIEGKSLKRTQRNELYLIYLFALGVAGSGLGGFFGHIFLSDIVARSVGWPTGSPFQLEMGFANLALGVLGIMATARHGGFRTATVTAVTVLGIGASLVHFYDILLTGNLAPGNTIQNLANLIKPALLILFLRRQHRRLPSMGSEKLFDEWGAWQAYHAQGAGIVTALVATGFGLGFAFDAVWIGSLAGILAGLALVLFRRPRTV